MFSSLTTRAGTGMYNVIQNKKIESILFLGENPYSGEAINIGVNSLKARPVRFILNYSSENSFINSIIHPPSNQQNMSTISIITNDDILRKYLK